MYVGVFAPPAVWFGAFSNPGASVGGGAYLHFPDLTTEKWRAPFDTVVDDRVLRFAYASHQVMLAAYWYWCVLVSACYLQHDVGTLPFHCVGSTNVFGSYNGLKLDFIGAVPRRIVRSCGCDDHESMLVNHASFRHPFGDFSDVIDGVMSDGCAFGVIVMPPLAVGG